MNKTCTLAQSECMNVSMGSYHTWNTFFFLLLSGCLSQQVYLYGGTYNIYDIRLDIIDCKMKQNEMKWNNYNTNKNVQTLMCGMKKNVSNLKCFN